jgi:Pilus assembly protein, PilO
MSKLPTPAKLGLLGAVVVLVLAAGWFLVIAPKRSESAKLQTRIAAARAEIASRQASRSPSHETAIRIAGLFNLSRAMPTSADIPGVLLQLSHVAGETGVSFDSVTPHTPVQLGSYQQIGVDLVFEGRFYDLSDFLYRLRNLVAVHGGELNTTGRLFSVDSISFEQGSLSFPQVKATLSVSVYVFGNGTPPPVAAGASSTGAPSSTASAGQSPQPSPAAPAGATAAGA